MDIQLIYHVCRFALLVFIFIFITNKIFRIQDGTYLNMNLLDYVCLFIIVFTASFLIGFYIGENYNP